MKHLLRSRFLPFAVALPLLIPASAAAQAWWVQAEPRVHEVRMQGPMRGIVLSSLGRGYLGVSLLNITEELREFYGAPTDAGVLVSQVVEDSPAASAGFRVGDVITAVGGEAVERSRDVVRGISRLEPEATVEVEVVRAGAAETLTATLGEREDGVWFGGDFEGPNIEHLELDLPDVVDSEEIQRVVREAMEGARERMRGMDFEDLARRLEETEERLRELEEKLAERQR